MGDAVLPVIVGVIAAVGAYAAARVQSRSNLDAQVRQAIATERAATAKLSGDVNTSEAETLWTESAAMRRELRDEVVSLRAEMVSIRADHIAMEAALAVTKEELSLVRVHAERCDRALAALQAKMVRIEQTGKRTARGGDDSK